VKSSFPPESADSALPAVKVACLASAPACLLLGEATATFHTFFPVAKAGQTTLGVSTPSDQTAGHGYKTIQALGEVSIGAVLHQSHSQHASSTEVTTALNGLPAPCLELSGGSTSQYPSRHSRLPACHPFRSRHDFLTPGTLSPSRGHSLSARPMREKFFLVRKFGFCVFRRSA